MKDVNGTEVLLNGRTFEEIADIYFDAENLKESHYSSDEIKCLKEGFIEGLEYMYPLYAINKKLVDIYEKIESIG